MTAWQIRINVSSCGGYTIVPTAVTYCAAKFYVSTFTEGLAWELKEAGAKMKAKVLSAEACTKHGLNVHAVSSSIRKQRTSCRAGR